MTFIEAYHVGFVVADLDATVSEFEDLLGVRWAAQQRRDMTVGTPDGPVQARFRFTYSTPATGGALIELIEGPPDSPWWPGEGVAAAFHHVGFWADGLADEAARLEAAGAPIEAAPRGEDGAPYGFAYHQLPSGIRAELVAADRRPTLMAWLNGAEFPQA
jgi:catechol 2,3-dioxygenase-like lactoylglutathione lyase family enzyme